MKRRGLLRSEVKRKNEERVSQKLGKLGKWQVEYEAEFVPVFLAEMFKEILYRKSTAGKGE